MHELLSNFGALGRALPDWVLGMSLWTGALFFAVWAADQLLSRGVRPAWRLMLYGAVFVRVLLPLRWESPLSLLPGSSTAPVVAVESAAASAVAPTLLFDASATPEASVPAVVPASVWGTEHTVASLYLLVALSLLGFMVLGRVRLGAMLRGLEPEATVILGGRSQSVRVHEHEHLGPLTFGILRPRIVVPRGLSECLEDEEFQCIVAHEHAHVLRKDTWLAAALSIATAVLWPILPVWFAGARIRQLIEQAADELALERMESASARTYGETLLKLTGSRPTAFAAPGLYLTGFRNLRGRIAALGRRSRLPALVQVASVGAVVAGLLACAGVAEGPEPAEDAPNKCETVKKLATTEHDRGERENSVDARLAALDAYEEYAESCRSDPDYGELAYYKAELLWSLAVARNAADDEEGASRRFAQAHIAFMDALAADPKQFTKDAAYAQMLSKFNELGLQLDESPLREEPADPPRKPRKYEQGVPATTHFPVSDYTAEDRQVLAAYETYEKFVVDPQDKELQKVRYHRAKLAMKHNRFDEAKPILDELLQSSDGSVYHVWGAEMLLDVLTIEWVGAPKGSADKQGAAAALGEFASRLEGMKLYEHEEADKLREAVPKLLAGLAHAAGE